MLIVNQTLFKFNLSKLIDKLEARIRKTFLTSNSKHRDYIPSKQVMRTGRKWSWLERNLTLKHVTETVEEMKQPKSKALNNHKHYKFKALPFRSS